MVSYSIKKVFAPLKISDLDSDIMSKVLYVINYDKSTIKGIELLQYIENTGILADIEFIDTSLDERFSMLESYMSSSYFHHFPSFNATILNCIYKLKKQSIHLNDSILTVDEEKSFTTSHKDLLQDWMHFFDSYLVYMTAFANNTDKPLVQRYPSKSVTNKWLGKSIVSMLLDPFFYDYFKTGIDESSVKYWKRYYDEERYDNKTFNEIMLNEANWIVKVLHDTVTNKQWMDYLQKST